MTDQATLDLIMDAIKEVREGQVVLNKRVTDHMDGEERERKEIVDSQRELRDDMKSFSAVMRAFVENENGDPDLDGHRVYHADKIKGHAEAEILKMTAKKKVVDYLVTGVFILIGFGVMGWVQSMLHGVIK